MTKTLLAICAVALSEAYGAASNYRFNLQEAATINGTPMKPGDYVLEVDGGKARIKSGKTVIEVPVKLETADHKFKYTAVGLEKAAGGFRIGEIDIGGSTTRIIFPDGTSAQ
jgi:hypothetical protein